MSAHLDLTPYVDDLIAWRRELLDHMAAPEGVNPVPEIARQIDRLLRKHGAKQLDGLPPEARPQGEVLLGWYRVLLNALDEGSS